MGFPRLSGAQAITLKKILPPPPPPPSSFSPFIRLGVKFESAGLGCGITPDLAEARLPTIYLKGPAPLCVTISGLDLRLSFGVPAQPGESQERSLPSVMPKDFYIEGMNLFQGAQVVINGSVLPAAKKFSFNLGKDENNLAFHFNPRVKIHNFRRVICCNSLVNGRWGQELRQTDFPFAPEKKVEVVISFEGTHFTTTLPDGFKFTFPNRLNLEKINFLGITGDFHFSSVDFK
ncbi:galectin-1-like [Dromiciops gliroides]|uniref:galectin-1-like n=1 Tax=Dromiciops gliroides TaxID=33562 RepID=UPI001CC5A98E|nr:galectin-1-like [Dromiciops gliroides]